MFLTRKGAANLLIGVVIGLIVLKATVAWLTGSISIIAQATDSLLDLFAGITTFFALRIAAKPADEEHRYGHGKVEDVASVMQGVFIFIAGALIIYSSIQRILEGTAIELTEVGMGAMLVSIIVSIFLSRHLLKVSQMTDSVILEANARNIASDVYSALAVLIGLLAVRVTGLNYIDSIIAIGVALYILKIAYQVVHGSLSGLIDTRLSPEEELAIRSSLKRYSKQVVGFHELRTRRAGSQHLMDLHLVMAKDIHLEQAHYICDQIETEIQDKLPESDITIHIEPCGDECEKCSAICSSRRSR